MQMPRLVDHLAVPVRQKIKEDEKRKRKRRKTKASGPVDRWEVESMTMEGTFHEIPEGASRQVSSSRLPKEIENYQRRRTHCGGRIFVSPVEDAKWRLLCWRAKVIHDIHTCLRFRFLAVLNIERAGRVRPYVERMFCNLQISLRYPAFSPMQWPIESRPSRPSAITIETEHSTRLWT